MKIVKNSSILENQKLGLAQFWKQKARLGSPFLKKVRLALSKSSAWLSSEKVGSDPTLLYTFELTKINPLRDFLRLIQCSFREGALPELSFSINDYLCFRFCSLLFGLNMEFKKFKCETHFCKRVIHKWLNPNLIIFYHPSLPWLPNLYLEDKPKSWFFKLLPSP